MIDSYISLLKKAKNEFTNTRKFFQRLKKVKPVELDRLFEAYHNRFSEEIDCLKCANCCRGTGPLLKERDISRLSKTLQIRTKVFIDTYLIRDEDGDLIFKELPCPFIDDRNFCFVYEDRPAACREYPHTDRRNMKKYLKPTLENYRICPIVYLVVEELKNLNL